MNHRFLHCVALLIGAFLILGSVVHAGDTAKSLIQQITNNEVTIAQMKVLNAQAQEAYQLIHDEEALKLLKTTSEKILVLQRQNKALQKRLDALQ